MIVASLLKAIFQRQLDAPMIFLLICSGPVHPLSRVQNLSLTSSLRPSHLIFIGHKKQMPKLTLQERELLLRVVLRENGAEYNALHWHENGAVHAPRQYRRYLRV